MPEPYEERYSGPFEGDCVGPVTVLTTTEKALVSARIAVPRKVRAVLVLGFVDFTAGSNATAVTLATRVGFDTITGSILSFSETIMPVTATVRYSWTTSAIASSATIAPTGSAAYTITALQTAATGNGTAHNVSIMLVPLGAA